MMFVAATATLFPLVFYCGAVVVWGVVYREVLCIFLYCFYSFLVCFPFLFVSSS